MAKELNSSPFDTTEKKKRKYRSYKEKKIQLTSLDQTVFAALYRHKGLSIQQIYTLLLPIYPNLKYNSFRVRLRRLEVNGYLTGYAYTRPLFTDQYNPSPPIKIYSLTSQSLPFAIEKLGLDYNRYSFDGVIQKNSRDLDDLKLGKNIEHHYLTQSMVVNALALLSEQMRGSHFLHFSYDFGDQAQLPWNLNDGTESFVRPDWLFMNTVHFSDKSLTQKIAIETDRVTMRSRSLASKFEGYYRHILTYEDEYKLTPLTIVFGVENSDLTSRIKRIRYIKHSFYDTMLTILQRNLLRAYVTELDNAAGTLARQFMPIRKPDDTPILELIETKTNYTFDGFINPNLYNYPSPEGTPFPVYDQGYKFIYRGNQFFLFTVQMEKGYVNSELRLIGLEKKMMETGQRAFLFGIYEKEEDLFNDSFIHLPSQDGSFIHMKNTLLTTPSLIERDEAYSLMFKNLTQSLKKVVISDVIQNNV